jgi:methionyl-tRNA formyltransferase
MKITLLCSESSHPVNDHLVKWINDNRAFHEISLVRSKVDLIGGDILFLVSCSEIIQAVDREKYKSCLLLHASDLPRGRGWSPYVWEIINGSEQITVSLLEAEDEIDSGRVWKKITTSIPKHALWNEINEILFSAEIDLIDVAVNSFNEIEPQTQSLDISPTYYLRRRPEDSRLNSEMSIAEQFDSIRVCDPLRYPAYFEMYGQRFKLTIEKMDE